METARKRGRPKVAHPKTAMVVVRVDAATHARLEAWAAALRAAGEEGATVSGVVRRLLLEGLPEA